MKELKFKSWYSKVFVRSHCILTVVAAPIIWEVKKEVFAFEGSSFRSGFSLGRVYVLPDRSYIRAIFLQVLRAFSYCC